MTSSASRQHPTYGTNTVSHEFTTASCDSDLSRWTANALAVQAQSGCTAAFAVLAIRFRPRLLRFIDKRVNGHHLSEAEDITQEVLAKAWQSLNDFCPDYQFTTWLYTIATRTATDHLRRSRRSVAVGGLEFAPDQKLSHEKRLEIDESVDNIWSIALRVLRKDQHSALWLRYGEDLSVKDVARVLGKSQVGVRVLLHRSRCALQPHLRQFDIERSHSQKEVEDV